MDVAHVDLAAHDGTEHSAKAILQSVGGRVPAGRGASSRRAAVDAAIEIGLPVAIKVHSSTIIHKTEVGGVRLNLRNPEEIKEAAAELAALGPGQVLVEAMAPEGVELILGLHHDPELGPVVMVGLGGVVAELYR